MIDHLDERLGRALSRWIAGVVTRPRQVAALALLGTLACGVYAALTLRVNADINAMIAPDVPFRLAEEAFKRDFQEIDPSILVTVEAERADVAARATRQLAEKLRERTDLFDSVRDPAGGPFFERNGLLYLDPEDLEDLSDRVAAAQPFLAEFQARPGAEGIARLLRQAVRTSGEGIDVGFELADLLDRAREAVTAAAEGQRSPDPWGGILWPEAPGQDGRTRVLALDARLDFTRLTNAEPVVRAVREASAELESELGAPVRVRLTGDTMLNYEELLVVRVQAVKLTLGSLFLVGIALFVALRSTRIVLATLANLIVCVVWTGAFAAAVVGHLNQVSAAFSILIIGLGVDFGIHFCMRYMELRQEGHLRPEALAASGESVGSSLAICAATTAIGFYVFVPTDYLGVAQLGAIAGSGMLIALASSVTLLPALLALGPAGEPRMTPAPGERLQARLAALPLERPRTVLTGAGVLAAAGILLLPQARFDASNVNLRDPSTESVQAIEALLASAETSPWTIDVIAPSLTAAEHLARELEKLPSVESTTTLRDFVPEDQEEKLAILEDAAYFLPEPSPGGAPTPRANRKGLAELEDALGLLADQPDETGTSARALQDALRRFRALPGSEAERNARLALLEKNLLGSLPDQLAELERALSPEEVTLASLPQVLTAGMQADDGRARIEVTPRENLGDVDSLERFVGEVSEVAPAVTGKAINLVEWKNVAVGALRQALIGAVISMSLLLWLLWRQLGDMALVVAPLALAAIYTGAGMVLLGMDFNFANIVVLPLLLGVGIDAGIHIVHRHRRRHRVENVVATSTGRAVLFSAVTTMASFASLAFASHLGMATLGQLLCLGLAITLVCYLVVLPALLAARDARGAGPTPAS